MQEIPFDQLLEATRTLQPQQRQALAELLRFATLPGGPSSLLSDLEGEGEVLNEAGAFSFLAPLPAEHFVGGKVTDAELIAASQCISCEWDEETIQE